MTVTLVGGGMPAPTGAEAKEGGVVQEAWITVSDAARLLGVSRAAVADAERHGRIRARWRSRGRRAGREIPTGEVVRWAARRNDRRSR